MASDYVMRWMVARDMPQIVGIERSLGSVPAWEETALRDLLRESNVIGMTVEHRLTEMVAGYVIYEMLPKRLEVIRLVVVPGHRRRNVATLMLDRLITKLSGNRRPYLRLDVPEECLDVQLWLRSRGVRCVRLVHDISGEVLAYRFRYRLPSPMTVEE